MNRIAITFFIIFFIISCTPINDAVIFNNQHKTKKLKAEKTKSIKKKKEKTSKFIIDNFNKKNKNLLGGRVSAWSYRPDDRSQECRIRYTKKDRIGKKGFSLKISYDVDSSALAFNGVYMELKEMDISSFNNIVFYIKGDKEKRFTSVFKLELKNNFNQAGYYYLRGITEKWQKIVIPLNEFKGLSDLTSMKELTIVFEDSVVTEKEGVIYMENLYLTK